MAKLGELWHCLHPPNNWNSYMRIGLMAGVTDFNAAIMPLEDGTMDATLDLLQSELG